MTHAPQPLSEALFGWLAGRLYPSLGPRIETAMSNQNQPIIDELAVLKTKVDQLEAREGARSQLLADLKAQVAAGADPSEVLATITKLEQQVESIDPDTTPTPAPADQPLPPDTPAVNPTPTPQSDPNAPAPT